MEVWEFRLNCQSLFLLCTSLVSNCGVFASLQTSEKGRASDEPFVLPLLFGSFPTSQFQ